MLRKAKIFIVRALFRILRDELVTRLRAEGLTWAVINRILRATGQKVIVRVEHMPKGPHITYAPYNPKYGLSQNAQKWPFSSN